MMRPRFTKYETAKPARLEIGWNKYGSTIIGVYVVTGHTCRSLQWRRP